MKTLKKGHYAELMAAAILTRNEFDVFHPLQGHGPIDLIAVKGDQVMLLDVKVDQHTQRRGRSKPTRIHRTRKPHQKMLGVRLAYLNINAQQLHITDHNADCQDAQPLVLT